MMTNMSTTTNQIDAVRRFIHFYTKRMGLRSDGVLGSRWSLSEARVIHVVADAGRNGTTGSEIASALDVPRGSGRPVDDEREPREVTRYLKWCREATAKLGAERLRCVVDCIIEGSECPLRLMKIALRMF